VLGKLTYANVMATVAMFIALGGLGYAATQLPRNSVGPKQLKKGAVTPKKLSADSKKTLRGAQGPKGEKGEKGDRGAPGPSTVYAGSSAADFIGLASPPSPVLSIPVPAGSYAIQAKLNSFSQGGADIVRCRLNAGDDFDSEDATIGDEAGATESASIAMQVVHTFSAAGTVSITCLGEGGGTGVAIKNIKITAIQVGGIAANTSS
jgi:hypothetical protein